MNEKIISLKNKILSFYRKTKELIKSNKIISIIVAAILAIVLLVIIVALANKNKEDNFNGNLSNLGFSLNINGYTYCLNYSDGLADGIYKIKENKKEKISDDYGYYLNKSGKYIYYLDPTDNNIVKMKANGKDKEIVIENVAEDVVTIHNDYIYYFANSYFYRAKTDGTNKKRISNKSIERYQIIGNTIYYTYKENGKYTIAKMKTDGEDIQKIDEECGKAFFIKGKDIYYIYENENIEDATINYELYKMKINGKNKKKISNIEGNVDVSAVNFTQKNAYYAKENIDGITGIYKIGLNGKSEIKLVDLEGFTTKININNNYIYYPDLNDNGEIQMYRVKLNGKTEKEIL